VFVELLRWGEDEDCFVVVATEVFVADVFEVVFVEALEGVSVGLPEPRFADVFAECGGVCDGVEEGGIFVDGGDERGREGFTELPGETAGG